MREGSKTASLTRAMSEPPDHADPSGPVGSQGMNLGMNQGVQVLSYLIAGIATYGFLGWLGDRWLGTGFLLPLGIVAGAALGIYVVIRRFTAALGTGSGDPTTKTKGRA